MSTLKLILRNGIRYSYAFESFPSGVINNLVNDTTKLPKFLLNYDESYGVALPMVSFCDIPITRALEHAKIYGKYGIGIEKDFMLRFYKNFFNPVIYSSGYSLNEAIAFFSSERLRTMDRILNLANQLSDEEKKNFFSKLSKENKASDVLTELPVSIQKEHLQRVDEGYNLSMLLALYKPYKGKNSYGKEQIFYDEREWRAFYPHTAECEYSWLIPCTREEYQIERNTLNDGISKWENGFITIPENCIDAVSHIIVKYDYQRDILIDYILKSTRLLGYPIQKNNPIKYKVISKISSFEKTEKDY